MSQCCNSNQFIKWIFSYNESDCTLNVEYFSNGNVIRNWLVSTKIRNKIVDDLRLLMMKFWNNSYRKEIAGALIGLNLKWDNRLIYYTFHVLSIDFSMKKDN